MEADPKVRIQYSAKYAGISNSWKKWQGEINGLKRLDAIDKKLAYENEFKAWAEKNGTWEEEYKAVFDGFQTDFKKYNEYIRANDYYSEIVFRGVELFRLAGQVNAIIKSIEKEDNKNAAAARKSMLNSIPGFLKNYNQPTDEKLFAELMPMLASGLNNRFLPTYYLKLIEKYGHDKLIEKVYRKSVLTNTNKLKEILKNGSNKQLAKLKKDPVIALYRSFTDKYTTDITPELQAVSAKIRANMKKYMAGIMEMKKGQPLYPDANFTLRVAYGKVEGYKPKDGVSYKYYTTLKGIMEKDNPEIYDYDVPDRLKELYNNKDYGRYEVDGEVPVCFTASNHTTGGNSGSPVVNGNGELIGVNFDRCWEGTMSDIMFDPERCRNITLDIRYALFLIDKFAGAGYLLNEMDLVE